MYYSQGTNRRKRWYRLLSIGQKKLLALVALLLLLFIAVISVLVFYTWRAAEYDLHLVADLPGGSMLYDSSNRPIAQLSEKEYHYVTWQQLPKNLVNAFVAREDENFFEHSGIVWSAVLRSLFRNLISLRYEQGASTITMQLTRNVYNLQGKSMDRKLLEAALAQRIEKNFDKESILTQYLNRIFFGCSCYGISEAASFYFGKPVQKLNLEECATLAGLVRGPSIFNPVRSMESAMAVKNETLARMLEQDMISRAEYEEAVAAPIVLSEDAGRRPASAEMVSYASMWAHRELEKLQSTIPPCNGNIAVVSSLDLPLQQYVEQAAERALQAVEKKNVFPEQWEPLLEADDSVKSELIKSFMTMKRPADLKARGLSNNFTDVLQCCVLVVDGRNGRKGNILAVISGRCAVDQRDRWSEALKPGRCIAPLLFCAACMPGGDSYHIVARSTEVTGSRLGYDVVSRLYKSLEIDAELPDREHENDLYNGLFHMPRFELARILFDIQNQGRGYRMGLINSIWNSNKQPLYIYEAGKAPEYIRRESAKAVAYLSPFSYSEGRPVLLNESLPENGGHWLMLSKENSAAVFVWMGFDKQNSAVAASPEIKKLTARASLYLAREIYAKLRQDFKAQRMEKSKESSKP